MEEESWERNHERNRGRGIMEEESCIEESWERNHGGGIMGEEPWRRNPGRGIMGEESWRRNHGRGIMGKESWGAIWRHLEPSRSIWSHLEPSGPRHFRICPFHFPGMAACLSGAISQPRTLALNPGSRHPGCTAMEQGSLGLFA